MNTTNKQIAFYGRPQSLIPVLQKTDCENCGLDGEPGNESLMVAGIGNIGADVMFVGEALGATEVAKGEPFVGKSGKLLNAMLKQVGLFREDVWITNACLCRPPQNRPPKVSEINACNERLRSEVMLVAPRVVFALGATAIRALLGEKQSVKDVRHVPVWLEDLHTYMVATYHPSAVLRNYGLFPDVLSDFKQWTKVVDMPVGGVPELKITPLILDDPYIAITFLEELKNSDLYRHIACDIETGGLNYKTDDILELGFCWSAGKTAILPAHVAIDNIPVRAALENLFGNKYKTFVWHNGKFDTQFLLYQWEVEARIDRDTMLLHYALDERRGTHSLKTLAREYCGAGWYDRALDEYLPTKSTPYSNIPEKIRWQYLALDVHYTLALYDELSSKSDSYTHDLLTGLILPATRAFAEIESWGVLVDRTLLGTLEATLTDDRDNLKTELCNISIRIGEQIDNPNSPQQVARVLYDGLGVQPYEGTRTTAVEALESFMGVDDFGFIEKLLDYRKTSKLLNTYVTGLKKHIGTDDRVHPDVLLHGTVTGRLSIKNPPLQTIPRDNKDIKRLFIASPGYTIVDVDYTSLEIMVAAYLSGDIEMLYGLVDRLYCPVNTIVEMSARFGNPYDDVIIDDYDWYPPDFHTRGAAIAFDKHWWEVTSDERQNFKRIIFGVLYGRGAQSLAEGQYGLENVTVAEAQQYIDALWTGFPQLKKWMHDIKEEVKTKGYLITPFGRRRRFPLLTGDTWYKIEKQAINFPIQSLASDICLSALVRIHEKLKQEAWGYVLFSVHDSITLEIKDEFLDPSIEMVEYEMKNPPIESRGIDWQVEIKTGKSWGETELWIG